jgi:hypothetical protein
VSGEIVLHNSRDSVDVYKAQRIHGGEAREVSVLV